MASEIDENPQRIMISEASTKSLSSHLGFPIGLNVGAVVHCALFRISAQPRPDIDRYQSVGYYDETVPAGSGRMD